jgi:hypothetical protein
MEKYTELYNLLCTEIMILKEQIDVCTEIELLERIDGDLAKKIVDLQQVCEALNRPMPMNDLQLGSNSLLEHVQC